MSQIDRERERGGNIWLGQAEIYSYKMKYSKLTVLERTVLTRRNELKSIPKTSWTFFTLSEFKGEHFIHVATFLQAVPEV